MEPCEDAETYVNGKRVTEATVLKSGEPSGLHSVLRRYKRFNKVSVGMNRHSNLVSNFRVCYTSVRSTEWKHV